MLDKFSRDEDLKDRKMLHCADCKRETIHTLEARCTGCWEVAEGMVNGGSTYSIFRCGACDTVCYESAFWDSEDTDHDFEGSSYPNVRSKQYPAPISAHFTFNTNSTPVQLNAILGEMLYALAGSQMILATIGLRLAIEFIVKDKKCSGKNLAHKIDDLLSLGHIDDDQKVLLHQIRVRGNSGAHDAKSMNASGILAGMAIVEGLLEKLYNGPARHSATINRAKQLFKDEDMEDIEAVLG